MIYDGHVITGDECGQISWRLSYNWGKPSEKTSVRKLTRPGIESRSAVWEATMLPVDHSGGRTRNGTFPPLKGLRQVLFRQWVYSFSETTYNKSMALQLRRAKTDWNDCCQMAVQEALWLAKRYPSTLISVFLTGFRYFSYPAATQLASRGWMDPVPDPILLENFLGYSRESNPGPLGWQSYNYLQ